MSKIILALWLIVCYTLLMNTTGLKQLGHGMECKVFEVNVKIVCKDFSTRIENQSQSKRAEFAYRMQRIAYRYGLAPRPLALEYNQYYSEHAKTLDNMGYAGSWQDMQNTEEFQKFIVRLQDIFGVFCDSHSGNIARLPNGNLCCIDFGICGFERSKIGKLLIKKLGIELCPA